MNTKNQISLARKSLYGIMLIAVFLATFGGGNLPSVRAQEAGTETTAATPATLLVRYLPELENAFPNDIKDALRDALLNRPLDKLPGTSLMIVSIRLEETWGMATVVSSDSAEVALAEGDTEYGLLQPGKTSTLLFVQTPNGWVAALAETQYFTELVKQVPLSELSAEARSAFMQSDPISLLGTNLLFPWRYNEIWRLTNGWHSDYYGNNAIDFAPVSGATREVLSVTDSTVIGICGPDALQVQIRTRGPAGDWYYLHLDKNQPYPQIGASVPQGTVVGKIFSTPGSFSSSCGYGTGPHVHLTAPSQNFTMDGWTVNSSNVWSKSGYPDKGVGSDFPSTNGGGSSGTCYTLSQEWTGNGNEPTASPANSSGCSSKQYKAGESINLTAHPASGWHLGSWSFTDSSSSSHLTMPSGNHRVVANYVQDTTSCNPNADQVAFFTDANYGVPCVVKGIGNYADPGAMSFANDSLSSIKVGSNVKLTLCGDENYGGGCETFTSDDSNLSDNSIGDERASSAKVETRGGSCTNGATYALLQPGYTYCAGEGGVCSFAGQASVAYGANNCYFYQTFTSSVSCSNGVFNDPISGTPKACHYKILTPAPSANFDAWGLSGTAPFTTAMHIIDPSNITSCSWNYGDGQTGTSCASSHNHTYNNAGTFTVSLTVSGTGGSNSMTRTNYITVSANPPSAPSLNSPGNGSSNPYNYDLTFQWNSVSGATEYQVEWWGGPYSTMQPCGWSSSTSCHIGTITPGNTYSWHVRARNGYGTSGWSSTWTFSIQPAPLPDLVPFPRPGASDPVVVSPWADWPYTETLVSGQTAYYYWGYKNVGQSDAGAHHVKVYVDDLLFIDYPFWGLGADNVDGFDNWSEGFYVAPGPHQVKIVVDANGEVSESNEDNNTWTGTVYWREPTVQLLWVFTTDDLGPAGLDESSGIQANDVQAMDYKDVFNPGDPIKLYLDIFSDFSTVQEVVAEWQVINPAGRIVPELSWTQTINVESWWWQWINRTIPTNSLRGEYTFIGKITYNGVTTTQTTTFTVVGTPAVEVYDVFVTDVTGNAASLDIAPQRLAVSDVGSEEIVNFNAGDAIGMYIDTYNDVTEGEIAAFEWVVTDPWGRLIDMLYWSGDLSSSLGYSWWYLQAAIPSNAITGDYIFTGYITYNGRTTLQSQTFHVNGPAGPSNDSFSAASLISSAPFTFSQDTWGATVATTDPTPTCGYGKNSNSVWYKYIAPANGLMDIDTWGSDYDTVLAIWTGSASSLTQIQCNDDAYDYYLEAWLGGVPVTAGTTYYIEVMDYGNPGGGALELYVDFAQSVSNDDFNTPALISAMPYTLSKDIRGATQANDDPALTSCNRLPGQASVWYKYTPVLSGELDLDTIGSNYDTMLAVWSGTRGNLTLLGCNDDIGDVGGVWDSDSTLTVPLVGGTTYYIEVSTFAGYIDVNGASANELQGKPNQSIGNDNSATSLEDLKTAVENGEASVTVSQGERTDEISAQFWGGQMQLNAVYHPVSGSFYTLFLPLILR
jgi:PKD repeat protein